MGIWGKRKERNKGQSPFVVFDRGYNRVREWWVKWMELATGEMSRANWIVLTVLFVGFGSVYYTIIIVRAFNGSKTQTIAVSRVKIPKQSIQTGEPEVGKVKGLDSINVKQLKREGYGEEGKNSKND